MIPMVDLKVQYRQIKEEVDAALLEVLENTQFILGPNVRAFEEEAAAFLGAPHAVGVASGTDALHLALAAAGVGEGDEVVTSPFTFIATAEAIRYLGGRPVFVDIDPRTFNIDPALVEKAITSRTKCVLPVHLFGQPADMRPLTDLCAARGLVLVEDCAQSFGADTGGKFTGTIGEFGCFSFFPSKNLGCYGDGGMVTAGTAEGAERLKVLRNHGSSVRYHHSVIGYNSRLDEMQAAILRVKLRRAAAYNSGRRRVAYLYNTLLAGSGVTVPFEDGKGTHVFHQYTILTDRRDEVMKGLEREGVACAVYYPIPLHRQEVFASDYADVSLPVAERVASSCLSLPIFPEMTDEQVERVAAAVRGALGE